MNTQQQAYVEGFVKRASEYGFNQYEAVELLKQAFDTSFMSDSEYFDGIPYARSGYNEAIGPVEQALKLAPTRAIQNLLSGEYSMPSSGGGGSTGYDSPIGPMKPDMREAIMSKLKALGGSARGKAEDILGKARDFTGGLQAAGEGIKEQLHQGYNDLSGSAIEALSNIDPRTAALIAGGGALAGGGGYLLKKHLDKKKQQQQHA